MACIDDDGDDCNDALVMVVTMIEEYSNLDLAGFRQIGPLVIFFGKLGPWCGKLGPWKVGLPKSQIQLYNFKLKHKYSTIFGRINPKQMYSLETILKLNLFCC